jgi:hypothetical protein
MFCVEFVRVDFVCTVEWTEDTADEQKVEWTGPTVVEIEHARLQAH